MHYTWEFKFKQYWLALGLTCSTPEIIFRNTFQTSNKNYGRGGKQHKPEAFLCYKEETKSARCSPIEPQYIPGATCWRARDVTSKLPLPYTWRSRVQGETFDGADPQQKNIEWCRCKRQEAHQYHRTHADDGYNRPIDNSKPESFAAALRVELPIARRKDIRTLRQCTLNRNKDDWHLEQVRWQDEKGIEKKKGATDSAKDSAVCTWQSWKRWDYQADRLAVLADEPTQQ